MVKVAVAHFVDQSRICAAWCIGLFCIINDNNIRKNALVIHHFQSLSVVLDFARK